MKRRELLLLGLGAQLRTTPAGAAPDTLRVAMVQHDIEGWIALNVLRAAYERAGLRLVPSMLPTLRASIAVATGEADAELMRAQSYGDDHPELVRVPTPFYRVHMHAYWMPGGQVRVSTSEDLRRYRVGIVRGLRASAETVARVPGLQPSYAINHEQLCRMLQAGHIDVAVDTQLRMRQMLSKLGMLSLHATQESPELASIALYHYVARTCSAQAPRIDAAIRALGPAALDRLAAQSTLAALQMKPGAF